MLRDNDRLELEEEKKTPQQIALPMLRDNDRLELEEQKKTPQQIALPMLRDNVEPVRIA